MIHSGPGLSIGLGYIPLVGIIARVILTVIVIVTGGFLSFAETTNFHSICSSKKSQDIHRNNKMKKKFSLGSKE